MTNKTNTMKCSQCEKQGLIFCSCGKNACSVEHHLMNHGDRKHE